MLRLYDRSVGKFRNFGIFFFGNRLSCSLIILIILISVIQVQTISTNLLPHPSDNKHKLASPPIGCAEINPIAAQ
ncbi:MAG: hypothetical protein OMM_14751 [Candidatus Magnetoglobus multicellularis str. Araruama]|uniref:Uncharacterized protein n=1 Tax=Candidatus Magnetoglobus multicellularis str. Araruama TaxID=890399 RepID=A0A1V1NRC5_9BACT|nr:MAG: hypothetical protein OMM_14751 [Candidatus Magnetoglobus multicellularis str. Araruama]